MARKKFGQVYLLTFPSCTSKKYVGVTVRKISERLRQHIYDSKRRDYPIHCAIRKYGADVMCMEVIATVPEYKLGDAEQKYIKQYDTVAPHGYNATYGGRYSGVPSQETRNKLSRARIGKKHTQETKEKISRIVKEQLATGQRVASMSMLGKQHTQETKERMSRNSGRPWLGKFGADNPSSKPVSQYDLQGNFIKTLGGQHEAARATGIQRGDIGSCCRGKLKTAGGYIWKYA